MRDRFSEVQAETFVAHTCFKTGPPRAVGIELEWLLIDPNQPSRPVTATDLAAAETAAEGLRSGRLTVEPGGQLEISSDPFSDPADCVRAVTADVHTFRTGLAAAGLALAGVALDPDRPPRRVLDRPRYVAMERYFDRSNPDGRTMMCSTAAVQVSVDAGADRATANGSADGAAGTDLTTRWALLHELAPVLVAIFANSPVRAGFPTGLRSARQLVWARLDPARTLPVHRPGTEDPRESWVRYVMAAPVLCIPTPNGDWLVPDGLTFRDWARGLGPRPATRADLDYHLTTLFPPVRPRGHLELRLIDAQRCDADWAVALAFVFALVSDAAAADAARAACAAVPATPAVLARAARDATADPELAIAAKQCMVAAAAALDRLGAGELRLMLERFAERYLERGRCPADDTLDDWLAGRRLPAQDRATPDAHHPIVAAHATIDGSGGRPVEATVGSAHGVAPETEEDPTCRAPS